MQEFESLSNHLFFIFCWIIKRNKLNPICGKINPEKETLNKAHILDTRFPNKNFQQAGHHYMNFKLPNECDREYV